MKAKLAIVLAGLVLLSANPSSAQQRTSPARPQRFAGAFGWAFPGLHQPNGYSASLSVDVRQLAAPLVLRFDGMAAQQERYGKTFVSSIEMVYRVPVSNAFVYGLAGTVIASQIMAQRQSWQA